MSPSVVIVGAGSVGVNAALFLSRLGVIPILLDSAPDILCGAAEASFINHGDGFEYYKSGHRQTGATCIDGALTKALIYRLGLLATTVCTKERPIRFLVSAASIGIDELTVDRFVENAEHMRGYFAQQFEAIRRARNWSDSEAEAVFLRHPSTFARRLSSDAYADVSTAAVAYAGSSFGINMPHYYAITKAAIRECGISFYPECAPSEIEKVGAKYRVHAGGRIFEADRVLLTAGHQIPMLTATIHGSRRMPSLAGTYFLNSMTFLRLPATSDPHLLEPASRINFTLQQEHGAMFACIVPPSPEADGVAATYYPSGLGSQLQRHVFDPAEPTPTPKEWEPLIRDGLPNGDEHVQRTFVQARKLYPFLNGYAEISHTICRTVFNAATPDSHYGTDRRVREILADDGPITSDGGVIARTAPKWTNAELAALMATDDVMRSLHMDGLPTNGTTTVGPRRLDIAAIAERMNFQHVKIDLAEAVSYARRQRIPSRIVDGSLASH